MNPSITFAAILCLCLVAFTMSAPTETPAGQASSETATSPSTQTSTSADQTSSAPATDDSSKHSNTTASMAINPSLNNSSFTCYGRAIGYYADLEQECKVYHFCLLGEYNGESVYQRISYLCLNDTVFDQQALDCVEPSKILAPCKESSAHFDASNAVLRQAIVGNQMNSDKQAATSS